MDLKLLTKQIKQKKELSGISDKIVEESLSNYLLRNQITLGKIKQIKPREEKLIVKEIRRELRLLSGRFEKSAEERKDFYSEFKKEIKKLNPKSILDIGCGENPIYLAEKGTNYYACDINEKDLEKVRRHFQKNKISGKVFFYDLRKISSDNLPKVDLCLILKVFDVLEKRGHKLAEKIILSIQAKHFLISFSTKTLSGKPMNHPQRGWIELLLKRLGFQFKIIKSKNEIYYLAEKL